MVLDWCEVLNITPGVKSCQKTQTAANSYCEGSADSRKGEE